MTPVTAAVAVAEGPIRRRRVRFRRRLGADSLRARRAGFRLHRYPGVNPSNSGLPSPRRRSHRLIGSAGSRRKLGEFLGRQLLDRRRARADIRAKASFKNAIRELRLSAISRTPCAKRRHIAGGSRPSTSPPRARPRRRARRASRPRSRGADKCRRCRRGFRRRGSERPR